MEEIIKENTFTFKELEKIIYAWVCGLGQEFTKDFLERMDRILMEGRDKKKYRNKGLRQTTVKTVYGEVTYRRTVYETVNDSGSKLFLYLLDENLELSHAGLISENLAELMVHGITELSYRGCAARVSEMTGQDISAMGVWNVIQSLGEKVCEDEKALTKAYRAGKVQGEREAPVLFEETDGVFVNLQGKDRRRNASRKAEVKVGIAYDGWKKERTGRYVLPEKVVVAGIANAKEFQEYREAAIAAKYNLDAVGQRIMNADGASWVKGLKDEDICFQLDPFHRNKAARERIHDRKACGEVISLLEGGKIDEMFHYLELYRNSLSAEKDIAEVDALEAYYAENREGLLPYQAQVAGLPEPPEGLEYRNMGTMESHIWSVIARRMKHNHTSWSKRGGNHLAKILAKKCSGRLREVTERLKRPIFEEGKTEEICEEILSSSKASKKSGAGYEYPVIGHLVGLEGKIRGDGFKVLKMAGY